MGLMPDEYYNMLPVDFSLMMNGHIQRIDRESSNHRKAAFLICKALGVKMNMQQFSESWPISSDNNTNAEKIETPELDYWQKVKTLNSRFKGRKKKK